MNISQKSKQYKVMYQTQSNSFFCQVAEWINGKDRLDYWVLLTSSQTLWKSKKINVALIIISLLQYVLIKVKLTYRHCGNI